LREDARKLSELLFLNKLHAVYHGETTIRALKELARSYLTITRDLTRMMNRPPNVTWAGEPGKNLCSFQSPGRFFS